jgi:glycosyltransferase involved in cell wall biosynthesis
MRIGIVTGEYPPMQGGVGAYTHILARELVEQGNSVHVFSSHGAKSDNSIPVENKVQGWGLGSLKAIRRWAAEQRFDVVNLQFQTAAFGMSPWIHFLPDALGSIPLVTTFHDLRFPYLFPKAGGLREWIVMRLAQESDGVIVTNHEDHKRLQHLSKVALIPIGSNILKPIAADFDKQAYREHIGIKSGEFLLTYFGLFNQSKGLEVLLEAVSELSKKDVPVRLMMIGSTGTSDPTNASYADTINDLIDKLGLQAIVQHTGYLNEETVGNYLSASDAVVLPFLDGASYRRGSLIAAIQYQTAIIATIPKVPIPAFKDGENMLLVKPGDAPALGQAIQRLIDSQDLQERLQDGAGKLGALFDWSQIARDTVQHFRWVVEESS